MRLPNLDYMVNVGALRYIQSVYEPPEYRNPDVLVRHLLSPMQRLGCNLRGKMLLSRLRAKPFYYYILARTRYYDAVFVDAIREGMQYIVNIGCGSDTRAYRFEPDLRRYGVRVLECDQPQAIYSKRQIAQRLWPMDHVNYQAIDLNDGTWPKLEEWLKGNRPSRMLVMMEGVSPYLKQDVFGRFLEFLAQELPAGSRVAYDFKLSEMGSDLGRSERVPNPFRLSGVQNDIVDYHAARGYTIGRLALSLDLTLRLIPRLLDMQFPLFREDALVQLALRNSSS